MRRVTMSCSDDFKSIVQQQALDAVCNHLVALVPLKVNAQPPAEQPNWPYKAADGTPLPSPHAPGYDLLLSAAGPAEGFEMRFVKMKDILPGGPYNPSFERLMSRLADPGQTARWV